MENLERMAEGTSAEMQKALLMTREIAEKEIRQIHKKLEADDAMFESLLLELKANIVKVNKKLNEVLLTPILKPTQAS